MSANNFHELNGGFRIPICLPNGDNLWQFLYFDLISVNEVVIDINIVLTQFVIIFLISKKLIFVVADLGVERERPGALNVFIFMQFSVNIGQIIGWPPSGVGAPFWEILDPPLVSYRHSDICSHE